MGIKTTTPVIEHTSNNFTREHLEICASNRNRLNNFGRGPPNDHSCKVWSKSIYIYPDWVRLFSL